MVEFIIEGLEQEKKVKIDHGDHVLGRTRSSSVRINHKLISREHAKITYTASDLIIKDLNSSNGIFVNGVKVSEINLYDGDVVNIKSIKLRVKCSFQKREYEIDQEDGSIDLNIDQPGSSINYLETGTKNKLESDKNYGSDYNLNDSFGNMVNTKLAKAENDFEIPSIDDISISDFKQPKSELSSILRDAGHDRKVEIPPKNSGGSGSIIGIVRDALIKPFTKVILQFDYKILIITFITLCMTLISYLVLFPQKINMENYIRNEAIEHAETIVHFLSKFNRSEFIKNNWGALNTKIAMEIPNVQAARIIRADGKIVAPVQDRYKEVTKDYLVAAVEAMMKGQVADIQKVDTNVYSIVSPIKAFTNDNQIYTEERFGGSATEDIIGVAQIEYSTEKIFTGNPYEAITMSAFFKQVLYCLIIGFILSIIIIKLTVPIFSSLNKQITQFSKSGKTKIETHIKLRELEDFVEALENVLRTNRSNESRADEMDNRLESSIDSNHSNTIDAYQCALQVVDNGLIVIDNDEVVVISNEAFARQMQYGSKDSVEGQHLQSIISDIEVYEKLKELVAGVDGLSETRIIDTIDISGFSTNILISKSSSGKFKAILFKEISS